MGHGRRRLVALTALCVGLAPAALARQAPPPAVPPPAAGSAAATVGADPALTQPLTPLDQFNLSVPRETAPAPAEAPEVRYTIKVSGLDRLGLERDFRRFSALQAGGGKAASQLQIDARVREDQALGERLLRAEGYYQGKVEISVRPAGAGRFEVDVKAASGPRFHFGKVAVRGPPTDPPGLPRQALTLAPGDPIVANAVRAAEANVTLKLPEQGYPFAKAGERDIALDPASRLGDYTLPVTPGPKSSFGTIRARGRPVFTERHMAVIARFKPGDPYDSRMLDDFRRALVATQLFGAVGVKPVDTGRHAVDGTEIADVEVRGGPAPPHTLSGSLGYETGRGVTLEGAWTSLNFFPPEGAVTVHGIAGSQQQLLGLQVTRSNAGARDRTLFGEIQASHDNTSAYHAYTGQVDFRVSRQSTPIWQKIWTYSAGVEAVITDETAYSLALGRTASQTYKIAGFRLSGGYDRSNSLLDPTRGFQLLASLDPEMSFAAATSPFVKTTLEGRVYVPATQQLTLAARLRAGATFGIDAQQLAPSRRFYEGGGGTIRGFGYQDVGPKAPDGTPLGGASMTDFSVEARYRFGNFGVVTFLDGGQAYLSSTPRFTDIRYGVGVGARYYTNFGPIRIDVGTPIARRPGESMLGVYISIGQAF